TLIRFAIAVGIFKNDHAISLGASFGVTAVIHAFGDPDTAVLIDVDVCRIPEQRSGGPECDFEVATRAKEGGGNKSWGRGFRGARGHEAHAGGCKDHEEPEDSQGR